MPPATARGRASRCRERWPQSTRARGTSGAWSCRSTTWISPRIRPANVRSCPASFGVAPIYTNRSDRARAPGSERARVRPAVDQEVSARDEARVGAADERAELAELRRVAEATGGGCPVAGAPD